MSDLERAKEIADSLSWPHKDAILNGRWIGSGDQQMCVVSITSEPWPRGVAQFLTGSLDTLTPLGLAVRRILEEGNNGK